MGDSLITIVAIFLAAILMFVFPLMSISERNDDIAQMAAQTATVEFVDNIRQTGRITEENYSSYTQTLAATGNSYDVELELKVLDENPGKKTAQTSGDKIGENIYYSEYTSQILDKINNSNTKTMKLKEGDIISVNVKNTNTTIGQMLKNFFYSITGNDTYAITASHSGVVMANGSEK
ncbi:MAG: hypothetical protein HFJ26_02670 [Clostridia bacterium]|jgi:hypothetical protein|nr:hypothetical protein [Clostridia bacterium]